MRNNSVKMRNNVNLFWYCSETVWFMSEKYRMISELKLNDYLKKDGQNCCSLLLGLRNDFYLHQNKFSACKSADDCKQFFCAFCGCFARIYRNLCRKQRISKLDFRQCVLNKKPRFSLFLSHSSPDDWKIHKALESKILQKHTPKYPKSLFLKIENIKVLWKTASENNLKKYDFELNP